MLQSIRAFLSPRGQVLFPYAFLLRIIIRYNFDFLHGFVIIIIVHKVDGSFHEDDDLKSKMDGYKISPQSGWIILRGWQFEVQNGWIQNKSTKWTDHPTRMTIWSPKQVHKVDESSHKDDNLKSKMDGYKTSPQSRRIIPHGWQFEVQNGWIQNKSTKWMDHPTWMTIWSPRQFHRVDRSSYKDDDWKSKMDGYKISSQDEQIILKDDDLKPKMDVDKTCPQSIPRG